MRRVVAIISDAGVVPSLRDLASTDLVVAGPLHGSAVMDVVDHEIDVAENARWIDRAVSYAWRTPLGRNLVRVSPIDRSRRLWRAAAEDVALQGLVRGSDVVVAADRDAVFAVWKMTRSARFRGQWAAVYGVPAALFALEMR